MNAGSLFIFLLIISVWYTNDRREEQTFKWIDCQNACYSVHGEPCLSHSRSCTLNDVDEYKNCNDSCDKLYKKGVYRE